MDEEIRIHIEMLTKKHLDQGMDTKEARAAALRQFGSIEGMKETCREVLRLGWLDRVFKDLRFACKTAGKSPGFTAVATLSMGLGIGVSTSIFSFANALLLRPLPVPEPWQLRVVSWSGRDFKAVARGNFDLASSGLSRGDPLPLTIFRHLQKECAGQAELFGYYEIGVVARARSAANFANGMAVSENFFQGLRAEPLIGRLLGPRDDCAGAPPVVVISYQWWKAEFGLDPGAIGQQVILDGISHTIVGVTPSHFPGIGPGREMNFYITLSDQEQLGSRTTRAPIEPWLISAMLRLGSGTTDAGLQGILNTVFQREVGPELKEPRIEISDGRTGHSVFRQQNRSIVLMLLGVVGVGLVVACANLSGFLLARGVSRAHEFAIRSALGAGRFRLFQQSLTESLLLGVLGSLVGLLIAKWGRSILVNFLPTEFALQTVPSLDFRVLTFAFSLAIVTAILSGLPPAWHAARGLPQEGLNLRVATPSLIRGASPLVVAQVALSLLLVAGAGLFVHTLVNLARVDAGFKTDHLLYFGLAPSKAGYKNTETRDF
ncbi:MAG TPA: ABC transporter permease, partial [Verrucomicrobiae bacterium]|nr:ABC transporter permease [Verrucomicrobiae bacterium]